MRVRARPQPEYGVSFGNNFNVLIFCASAVYLLQRVRVSTIIVNQRQQDARKTSSQIVEQELLKQPRCPGIEWRKPCSNVPLQSPEHASLCSPYCR